MNMTVTVDRFLEQFRQLSRPDQRELCEILLQEVCRPTTTDLAQRKTIAEIAGKYRPSSCEDISNEHDRWFSEAIAASKAG